MLYLIRSQVKVHHRRPHWHELRWTSQTAAAIAAFPSGFRAYRSLCNRLAGVPTARPCEQLATLVGESLSSLLRLKFLHRHVIHASVLGIVCIVLVRLIAIIVFVVPLHPGGFFSCLGSRSQLATALCSRICGPQSTAHYRRGLLCCKFGHPVGLRIRILPRWLWKGHELVAICNENLEPRGEEQL